MKESKRLVLPELFVYNNIDLLKHLGRCDLLGAPELQPFCQWNTTFHYKHTLVYRLGHLVKQ
jgi:hypothetical protein